MLCTCHVIHILFVYTGSHGDYTLFTYRHNYYIIFHIIFIYIHYLYPVYKTDPRVFRGYVYIPRMFHTLVAEFNNGV